MDYGGVIPPAPAGVFDRIGNLYGFQGGEGLEGRTLGEFLALQLLNHGTGYWIYQGEML